MKPQSDLSQPLLYLPEVLVPGQIFFQTLNGTLQWSAPAQSPSLMLGCRFHHKSQITLRVKIPARGLPQKQGTYFNASRFRKRGQALSPSIYNPRTCKGGCGLSELCPHLPDPQIKEIRRQSNKATSFIH